MKTVRLICATRYAKEQFPTQTALGRSLKLYGSNDNTEAYVFTSNTQGLPHIYNSVIEYSRTHPAILAFIHDDLSLCDLFWVDRIREAVQHFDLVGLVGNTRRVPRQPSWFVTPNFRPDRQYLSGRLGHGKGFPSEEVAVFGPSGRECKLLDGLLLFADSECLNERGMRFDEQFDFHFYDLDFCRQAESKGLRMGTWPISAVHESRGNLQSSAWRDSYARYLKKYGE